MIHIIDDESNVTTESKQIFGIFLQILPQDVIYARELGVLAERELSGQAG